MHAVVVLIEALVLLAALGVIVMSFVQYGARIMQALAGEGVDRDGATTFPAARVSHAANDDGRSPALRLVA